MPDDRRSLSLSLRESGKDPTHTHTHTHTHDHDHDHAADAFRHSVLVQGRGLGFRAAGEWLVSDVDIAVARKQTVVLVGPNGGGKTTLLRMLVGSSPHHRGNVWHAPGLRIGVVPQRLSISVSLPLRVDRFIKLGQRSGASCSDCCAAVLDLFGVEHCRHRFLSVLSGGEMQRVLLARACAGRPDLLALDEPAQGLDIQGENTMYQAIERYQRETGCGVLMVSHDIERVIRSASEVVCLNKTVRCRGLPKDLCKDHDDPRVAFLAHFSHHHQCAHDHYAHDAHPSHNDT